MIFFIWFPPLLKALAEKIVCNFDEENNLQKQVKGVRQERQPPRTQGYWRRWDRRAASDISESQWHDLVGSEIFVLF